MVDDRPVHGTEDAVRNVRGAWDLKKVTAGMNHNNLYRLPQFSMFTA